MIPLASEISAIIIILFFISMISRPIQGFCFFFT